MDSIKITLPFHFQNISTATIHRIEFYFDKAMWLLNYDRVATEQSKEIMFTYQYHKKAKGE